MTEKYVDPGHRLSDGDWAKVVARAAEVRAELAAEATGGASGPGGIVVDLTARGIASKKYFPVSGLPTQLLVLHSAECPLQAGFAVSLTEWFQATVYPGAPIASWQRFVDPVHRVRALPDELGAWHASEANPLSIGWEQAGYARFSRAEWTTPDGLAQLELLAFDMAEVAVRDGIPARWLNDWEVRQVLDHGNRSIKGFCLHRQIDPETRTDPGNGYPYDLLMERIQAYMGGEPIPTQEDEVTTQAQIDEIVHRVNVFNQANAQDVGAVIIAEIRANTSAQANRILDALRELPQIPDSVVDELKAELDAGLDESLESIGASLKEKLGSLTVTLRADQQEGAE